MITTHLYSQKKDSPHPKVHERIIRRDFSSGGGNGHECGEDDGYELLAVYRGWSAMMKDSVGVTYRQPCELARQHRSLDSNNGQTSVRFRGKYSVPKPNCPITLPVLAPAFTNPSMLA